MDGSLRTFRHDSVPLTTARRVAPDDVVAGGWTLRTVDGMLAAASCAGSFLLAIGWGFSVRWATTGAGGPLPGRLDETIGSRLLTAAVMLEAGNDTPSSSRPSGSANGTGLFARPPLCSS